MGFNNKLVFIWLYRKKWNLKKWFLKWKWFYKTEVAYLILKYFLKDWNFIKIILKLDFVDWHVLQENWDEAYMLIFRMIYET